MNFYDVLLAKNLGGGGSTPSVDIEPLSVTQNGVYEAPAGKAYDPVTVSVSGGAFTPKFGVIRPDAELVNKWTIDELLVEDGGITLPDYASSPTTLKRYQDTERVVLTDDYRYFLTKRAFVYPIKTAWVHEKGAFECSMVVRTTEMGILDGDISIDRTLSDNQEMFKIPRTFSRLVSDNSATGFVTSSNLTYGIYPSYLDDSWATNRALTITHPTIFTRGSATYLSESDWMRITDVRVQEIIELYRVPAALNELDGWDMTMNRKRFRTTIINGGTLT